MSRQRIKSYKNYQNQYYSLFDFIATKSFINWFGTIVLTLFEILSIIYGKEAASVERHGMDPNICEILNRFLII